MVRPVSATRILAPGGSFIWPKTRAVFCMTPDSGHFRQRSLPSGSFAHAGENGIPAVFGSNIADQLLNQYGFSHASSAEQVDFFRLLRRGASRSITLDSRLQNFHGRALVGKSGPQAGEWAISPGSQPDPLPSMDRPERLNMRPSVPRLRHLGWGTPCW